MCRIRLKRFSIWKSNLDYISKHNKEFQKGIHSFDLGMNQFGDLVIDAFYLLVINFRNEIIIHCKFFVRFKTNEEFVKIFNGYNATLKESTVQSSKVFKYDPNLQVPDSIDWYIFSNKDIFS